MGVKIAHALGAEVTVLSQSLRKKDDGLKLGADHYYATSDPKTFEELRGSFDLILSTVSAPLDLDKFLSLLRSDGAFVNVGAPEEPVSLNLFSVIGGRKTLMRLGYRWHPGDPGDAGLLCRARVRGGDRADQRR